MMGGTIWLESEVEKGSTFSFIIPFEIGKNIEPKTVNKNPYRPTKSFHILMAEDDIINQTVLARMLTEMGHRVTLTNNGEEVVEAYSKEDFDIILMDIQMPVLDGIEAFKLIRSQENIRGHIPVIALTAFALAGDRERFLKMGMDEYIAKPVKMEELLFLIDRVILTQKGNPEYHEIPTINEKGELIFVNNSNLKAFDEMLPVIIRIEAALLELQKMIQNNNHYEVEDAVHKVKELFGQLDAQELKDIAFKIELSARRGSYNALQEYMDLLVQKFDTLKKSWNL